MKALFIGSTVRNWRRIGLAGEARIWGKPVNWYTFGWQPEIRWENQLRLVVYPTIYRVLLFVLHINIHPRWWSPDFWSINIMFSTAWKGRGVEGTWAWEVRFFLEKEVHCLKLSWFSTFRSILPSVFFMGSLIAVIISNSQWWYTKPNNILTWVCFFLSKPKFLSTPQILTWNLKMMGFQKHPDFPVADVQVHDKTCQG